MKNTTQKNISFSEWALHTYSTKKEAVEFLANSIDPIDRAIGTVIKMYAGCEGHAE